MKRLPRRARTWGALLGFTLIPLLPVFLCSCGPKEEGDKSAGYYTGDMKPKSERMKNAKGGGQQ